MTRYSNKYIYIVQSLQQCYECNIDSGVCNNRYSSVMRVILIVVCLYNRYSSVICVVLIVVRMYQSLQQRYVCNINSGVCVSIVTAALCV